MLVQTSYIVTSSFAFPTPWCLCGRMSEGMVLLHLHKLLCSAVISHLLHQLSPTCSWWRSGRCVLFPSECVQLQLNSCSDVQPWHTCCVRCPPCKVSQTSHQRKDFICACTHGSLSFFSSRFFVLNLWDVLTTGIDHAFYWSLLTGIDGPVRFKSNQLRSYQVPECENYTSEKWRRKWYK